MGTLGRGGVVLAMSGGLVATMGGQASALTNSVGQEAAAPATAPIAVQPAAALESGILAAPAAAQASAVPLTAPETAKVTFETGAFKAVLAAPKRTVTIPGAIGTGSDSEAPAVNLGGFGSAKGSSILSIASRYIGVPYVYGGSTPRGWDCSGSVGYIFRQAGIDLPRTANEQLQSTTRISSSQVRAGDLVFFLSGGRAYHVGIADGQGGMYDAQRTGKSFTHRDIYSANVVYGRV